MDELLAKLLAGEATAEEQARAAQWLDEDISRREAFADLEKIWEKSGNIAADYSADTDAAWEKVKRKMNGGGTIIPLQRKPNFMYRAAAVFAFLLSVSVAAYFIFGREQAAEGLAVTYKASDRPKNDTLADGSRITLNSGAVLVTSENFNAGKERRVKLTGEAFFDVAHNKEQPFIIEAGEKTTVRVLGTSFNVNTEADGSVDVVVATGRVLFANGNDSLILTAGESGHYDPASGSLAENENRDPNFDSWKTHKLVFNDTELEKVVAILNQFYRADIRIGNGSLRSMRLTATYENESLEHVLELLRETFGIRIVRDNAQITLEKDSVN